MSLTPPSSQHIQHHRHHQHKDKHNGSNISEIKPDLISCNQYSTQISLGIKNLMLLSPPLNPTLPTTKPSNCIAINDYFDVINEKPPRSIISSNLPSTYPYNTSIDQSKLPHPSTNSKPNFLKFNCPKPTFREPLSPAYSTGNKTYTGTKLSFSSVAYLHTPPPSVLCKSASYFTSSEDEKDDDNDENDYDSDDYEEEDDEYSDEDYFNLKYQKLSSQTYQTF